MTESFRLDPERKYQLLLQISEEVRGTLDLEEVLDHLIDTVKRVVDYDAAGIFVLNKTIQHLFPVSLTSLIAGMAMRGFPRRAREDDPMLNSGKGIIGHVIATGETVVAPDVRLNPYYVAGRNGTLSEIAVPIIVDKRVIGALNLESNRLNAFSQADAEILRFISNAAAISIEKAILHRQILGSKRLENQLITAKEVQAGLLPDAPPHLPGYDIAAVNLPNSEIGGDYFDYIDMPCDRVGITIADVSGKGVPAALIMATFRALLRSQVRQNVDLANLLQSVNSLLTESTGASAFVTAFYGILDPLTGSCLYANCGHNPPLLLHANGGTEMLESGGVALGVFGDAAFESVAVTLERGDVLVLYTDGVIELSDARGEELGPAGLEKILRQNWDRPLPQMIDSVVGATRALTEGQGYPDDFTLVLVRRQP